MMIACAVGSGSWLRKGGLACVRRALLGSHRAALQQPALFRETRVAQSSPLQTVVTIAMHGMDQIIISYVKLFLNNEKKLQMDGLVRKPIFGGGSPTCDQKVKEGTCVTCRYVHYSRRERGERREYLGGRREYIRGKEGGRGKKERRRKKKREERRRRVGGRRRRDDK